MKRRSTGLAAACLALTLGLGPARAADAPPVAPAAGLQQASSADVDTLFAAFGKSPGLAATFRETRTIALLSSPLKSEGTIHFDRGQAGGKLAKHTRTPTPKSVLLAADSLTVWDGKKTDVLSLASAPGLKIFADSFRLFLAANRAGLEKNFEMKLAGDPNASWQLVLVPRDPSLKKAVASIAMAGHKNELSTLTVKEANGDVTTTEFHDVNTAKKYTEAEAKDVFRVPPKLP